MKSLVQNDGLKKFE